MSDATDASDASGFSRDWLTLREPFDHAARDAAWAGVDLAALAGRWRGGAEVLQVVDLGCGIGANLRELAPRLQGAQRWTLVDHDAALLQALPDALAAWAPDAACRVTRRGGALRLDGAGWHADVTLLRCDLASDLARVPLAPAHLVCASALLDLVSPAWFAALLDACPNVPALLFALSADARIDWAPPDDDDTLVRRHFADDQRRDKGFGPAWGAAAPAQGALALQARGWRVRAMPSDWHIDARCGDGIAMQRALIDGMASAALAQAPAPAPDAAARIADWQRRRRASAATAHLTVGHVDLLATRD